MNISTKAINHHLKQIAKKRQRIHKFKQTLEPLKEMDIYDGNDRYQAHLACDNKLAELSEQEEQLNALLNP